MPTMMQIFAEELQNAGRQNPNIVALSADVSGSTGLKPFAEEFPDRYYEMGVSEQNMISTAAGLALEGKTAVASSYACFSPGRSWEQIRNTVCLEKADVKIIGAHIGVGSGRNGATHQSFEDIALMTCLPEMTVFSPATQTEVRLCAREILNNRHPSYLRLSARLCPEPAQYCPDIHGLSRLRPGTDFAVVGTGSLLEKALQAAELFEQTRGLSAGVFSLACLSPLNKDGLAPLRRFKGVLCVEEHQINGGLSSLLAPLFAADPSMPPFERVGVNLKFGASMDSEDLYDFLELSEQHIFNKLNQLAA